MHAEWKEDRMIILHYKIRLKEVFVYTEPSALISFLSLFFGNNTPAPAWIIHESASVKTIGSC